MNPWFRVGRLEVTTTVTVVLVTVATWLVWVIQPSLPEALYFSDAPILRGQVWRLITWPFAEGLSFWSAVTLFFFWYFGTDLEHQIGSRKMVGLLAGVWGALTVPALLLALLFPGQVLLAGLGLPEFLILLLWIAENPTRRFLFNIPAWVFGVAILALQILTLLASRGWASLLVLMLGLMATSVVARRVGLLASASWLPRWGSGKSPSRRPRPTKDQVRRQSDRERLDALLDKINAVGIGGLSSAEKKELHKLRDRLRGPQ